MGLRLDLENFIFNIWELRKHKIQEFTILLDFPIYFQKKDFSWVRDFYRINPQSMLWREGQTEQAQGNQRIMKENSCLKISSIISYFILYAGRPSGSLWPVISTWSLSPKEENMGYDYEIMKDCSWAWEQLLSLCHYMLVPQVKEVSPHDDSLSSMCPCDPGSWLMPGIM